MPNHVYTYLHAPKKVIDFILVKDDKGSLCVDFNKVIPMPVHQPDLTKPNPFYAEGGLGTEEEQKFGRDNTWYWWSINNWGTKWNAYSTIVEGEEDVYFETAWSPASPVYLKLSEIFPDAVIKVSYQDEGGGFKCIEIYKGGVLMQDIDLTWQFSMDRTCPKCGEEYCYLNDNADVEFGYYTCCECDTTFKQGLDGNKIIIEGDIT